MRACRPTQCRAEIMTSNRKISPHQSLRDSFSSRRSRLAEHCLHFRGARQSRDGGVKVHQTQKIHSNRRCALTPPRKNEPLFSQRLKSFVLFKVSFEGFKFFFKNCGKSFAKLSIELFNALCLFVPKVFINIKNLLKRFK